MKFLKLSLFLCILKFINFWAFWFIDLRLFLLMVILAYFFASKDIPRLFERSYLTSGTRTGLVCLFVFLIYSQTHFLLSSRGEISITSYLQTLLKMIVFTLFALTNKDVANDIINFLAKSFGVLLALAIVTHIVGAFVELPYFLVPYLDADGNISEFYGVFKVFIFDIQRLNEAYYSDILRFSGPFLEPGHIGTFLAFLLYMLKFDFTNKWVKILCVAQLMTLSLAGYLLTVVGFVLCRVTSIKRVLAYAIILFSFIAFFQNYNDGNNVINEQILTRLEYDADTGISGNNRNVKQVDDLWASRVINDTNAMLFGLKGYEDIIEGSTGYKPYIISFGVIPVLILLVFYFLTSVNSKTRRFSLGFTLLFFLSFLQRPQLDYVHFYLFFFYSLNNPIYLKKSLQKII